MRKHMNGLVCGHAYAEDPPPSPPLVCGHAYAEDPPPHTHTRTLAADDGLRARRTVRRRMALAQGLLTRPS